MSVVNAKLTLSECDHRVSWSSGRNAWDTDCPHIAHRDRDAVRGVQIRHHDAPVKKCDSHVRFRNTAGLVRYSNGAFTGRSARIASDHNRAVERNEFTSIELESWIRWSR